MKCETIEEVLAVFNEICVENDSDNEDEYVHTTFGTPVPCPPKGSKPIPEPFINYKKYIEENCENKIHILERARYHQIKHPLIICFGHFQEKCYYFTKYLDIFYQLALKYGDQIEFIVADLIDMDVIHPHANPIEFFCSFDRSNSGSPRTYIINEKKQSYFHYDAYSTVETFSEICDVLLDGTLYLSQPVPVEENDTLVKIAVYPSYDDLITKSAKDILLIVALGQYRKFEEYEPNYEHIAEELTDSNVEVVYFDGTKNYVPFNLNVNYYPTIIFIPHDDKDNFVHFENWPRDTEKVLKFVKDFIGPQGNYLRNDVLTKSRYRPFCLPLDYELDFKDLHQYINENFFRCFKVLDRNTFRDPKQYYIIYFMNIEEKGVMFHLDTLKKIYQVAENKQDHGTQFLVADIKDLDIIYPYWYKQYIIKPQKFTDIPIVFGIDHLGHAYKANDFPTASSLYYFYTDLIYSHLFYSQPWRMTNNSDLVTTCVAHNLKLLIKKSKRDIFLTIFKPIYKESFHILQILDEIANEKQELNVKIFKMDAEHNYVPLEYCYPTYPVHFYIPCRDKHNGTTRYVSSNPSKNDIMDFIRQNYHKHR